MSKQNETLQMKSKSLLVGGLFDCLMVLFSINSFGGESKDDVNILFRDARTAWTNYFTETAVRFNAANDLDAQLKVLDDSTMINNYISTEYRIHREQNNQEVSAKTGVKKAQMRVQKSGTVILDYTGKADGQISIGFSAYRFNHIAGEFELELFLNEKKVSFLFSEIDSKNSFKLEEKIKTQLQRKNSVSLLNLFFVEQSQALLPLVLGALAAAAMPAVKAAVVGAAVSLALKYAPAVGDWIGEKLKGNSTFEKFCGNMVAPAVKALTSDRACKVIAAAKSTYEKAKSAVVGIADAADEANKNAKRVKDVARNAYKTSKEYNNFLGSLSSKGAANVAVGADKVIKATGQTLDVLGGVAKVFNVVDKGAAYVSGIGNVVGHACDKSKAGGGGGKDGPMLAGCTPSGSGGSSGKTEVAAR